MLILPDIRPEKEQSWQKILGFQVHGPRKKNIFSTYGRNLSDNWGGGYSYIRVMPDGFLLKSIQIQEKSVVQNMNI